MIIHQRFFTVALTLLLAQPGWAVTARPADDFVESLGIVTHFHHPTYDPHFDTILKPRILELGIRWIRESTANYDTTTFPTHVQRLQTLSQSDIHFVLTVHEADFLADTPSAGFHAKMAQFLAANISIGAFENENERDHLASYLTPTINPNNPYCLQPGLNNIQNWLNRVSCQNPDWREKLLHQAAALRKFLKSSPATRAIPVMAPSLVHVKDYATQTLLTGGNLLEEMRPLLSLTDIGTDHIYCFFGGHSTCFATQLAPYQQYFGSKPLWVGEMGYHTYLGPEYTDGVTEIQQAKYLNRSLLEYFNANVEKVFIYELFDQGYPAAPTQKEGAFGLLRNDGSRKPAFTALRDLVGLLQDPGPTFTPGSLDITITGGGTTVQSALMQKRNGRFYLAVWNEVGRSTDTDASKTVSVQWDVSKNVNVYRHSQGSTAIATYNNVTNLSAFTVPDDVLVLELY